MIIVRRVNFDLDVLRSFVTGMELGSFARAADHLGRSTSAVSAQLKKLEEQAGVPVFRKSGRGLALTDAGETMLAYARRLLDLNDEAATVIAGADLAGRVRFGVQEDLGEALLPEILGRFARAHPRACIEAHVARNADLLNRVASAELDLAIAWGDRSDRSGYPAGEQLAEVPMRWIGPVGAKIAWQPSSADPLPLVMFEAPCLFRVAATNALDKAGISWRIAFTSTSLAGLWAATSAGLGVTLRTEIGLPQHVTSIESAAGLPAGLPTLPLVLHTSQAQGNPVTSKLIDIMRDTLRTQAVRKHAA
jgi:DNA-binding transcriptional LysR family regulator